MHALALALAMASPAQTQEATDAALQAELLAVRRDLAHAEMEQERLRRHLPPVVGCAPGKYCPHKGVRREDVAVFVLRTLDPLINPPQCVPPNMFADVPKTSPYCRWIEELANRGGAVGCGGGNFCPAETVTREEMAAFITVTFALNLYGP